MKIASLHIYPVKGCHGTDLASASVEARGLAHDRRFMLVDENNHFLTQREVSDLTKLKVDVTGEQIVLSYGRNRLELHQSNNSNERADVVVWKSTVNASIATEAVNDTLATWFGRPVKLAIMDKAARRETSTSWVDEGKPVSFADGYPILIVGTASLDALNATICEHAQDASAAVPMSRFRPNIVIETSEPWIEDTWKKIQLGDVVIDLTKPCDRCVVTTLDQDTGQSMGNEPSASLMRIRRSAHPDLSGVLFGWNSIPANSGIVAIGDDLQILDNREDRWPLHSA